MQVLDPKKPLLDNLEALGYNRWAALASGSVCNCVCESERE